MTYDAKELEQYPEIMNKEQLRKACHISKRTAHYLLKFNLIPHVCTGKKTRCYAIKKRDVIDFMINREVNPSRYIVPTSWYKYGNEDVKPYKIRIQPPLPNDPQKTRRYYESKLADYPDVIDVTAIVDFTGYNRHTVCEWIRFGKLRALALQHKYMIPKCYLIDWLSTDEHNATTRKCRRQRQRRRQGRGRCPPYRRSGSGCRCAGRYRASFHRALGDSRGSAERCSRERGWRRAGGRSNRRARALSQTFPCAPRF